MERISLGLVMAVVVSVASPARAGVQVRYEVDLKAIKKVATISPTPAASNPCTSR